MSNARPALLTKVSPRRLPTPPTPSLHLPLPHLPMTRRTPQVHPSPLHRIQRQVAKRVPFLAAARLDGAEGVAVPAPVREGEEVGGDGGRWVGDAAVARVDAADENHPAVDAHCRVRV
jgi:hypothetical protein